MVIIETVIVAFSMFSALPMPHIEWNERNMKYSLLAFPLIGAVIGILMWLWFKISMFLALPAMLRGAILCLIPVSVNGSIHLDGYADTCDALASHASPEKKQQILRDPHMGAFAAIKLCMYFLLSFALWTALPEYNAAAFLLMFCFSRTLSALALTSFNIAEGSSLAKTFADAADRKRVRMILGIFTATETVLLVFAWGAAMIPAGFLVFIYYRYVCIHEFGGLSGDLAGWFLQKAELWMLAAMCLWQFIGVKL